MCKSGTARDSRQAGLFAPGGSAAVISGGRVTGHRIENPALQYQGRGFADMNCVFDANLWRPGPQISGVRERGNGQGGERSCRERNKEERVLPGDERSILPVEANGAGAQAHEAEGSAVGNFGIAAGEIKMNVGAGACSGNRRAKGLQGNLRLAKTAAE